MSVRYTLEGLYRESLRWGQEERIGKTLCFTEKNKQINEKQDAIFNMAYSQRLRQPVLVSHCSIDGYGTWHIPFDTANPALGIHCPELLVEVGREKSR